MISEENYNGMMDQDSIEYQFITRHELPYAIEMRCLKPHVTYYVNIIV